MQEACKAQDDSACLACSYIEIHQKKKDGFLKSPEGAYVA